MTQREKGDETAEIPSFSQDDEWWNKAVVLEAIIELGNAFIGNNRPAAPTAKLLHPGNVPMTCQVLNSLMIAKAQLLQHNQHQDHFIHHLPPPCKSRSSTITLPHIRDTSDTSTFPSSTDTSVTTIFPSSTNTSDTTTFPSSK